MTEQTRDPIPATTEIVTKVELRHGIHRERPFLIPKPSATPAAPASWAESQEEWEELQEEKEQRQYTIAVVAGLIVVMAAWLWLLAYCVRWVGMQIWHAIGEHAWQHILGGGLSL